MPTKTRTTKKPAKATRKPRQAKPTADEAIAELGRRANNAAKPKRYVRVAVKAGKATLQESDHPNRGFKPKRQPKPTAEDIGRSIGDALGRRLEDLLSKPKPGAAMSGRAGFDAVSAWTVENLGDGVTGYRANYAEQAVAVRQSALGNAIDRLSAAISAAEVLTDNTHVRLQDVLGPPVPTAGGNPSNPTSNDSPLTCAINDFADRIYADSRRRNDILQRLEL